MRLDIPETPSPRVRHVHTLGRVQKSILDFAVELWRAVKIDQPVNESDVVLILVDEETVSASTYVQALKEIDRHRCPVALIPISQLDSPLTELARLLNDETIRIDFNKSRFRLTGCAEANLTSSPPVLRRALCDDELSVAEDLQSADLLVLQGHAGAVDGGFGRWLNFCSRHLHKPGESPVFPCFDTDRCFRQEHYQRPATSVEGLVDPASLRTPLLVLNGCGTLVIPGTLFRYETSIARSVMASQVRAAVMNHGISSTPLSVLLVFLAMLGRGKTLGEAVREANSHAREVNSPSSIEGAAVAPWILVGNPDARVVGVPLIEKVCSETGGNLEFCVNDDAIPSRTGTIVSLSNIAVADGPFDVSCDDGRWARGAVHGGNHAYIWLSGGDSAVESTTRELKFTLLRRPNGRFIWRERARWLQANRGWLERMSSLTGNRGGNEGDLRSLISFWADLSPAVELLSFAASPHQEATIVPPLKASSPQVVDLIQDLDRLTALTVAAAIPFTGARLSRLWYPPWLEEGFTRIAEQCACGCPIAGVVRRHAILDVFRIVLTCPACGPIGDVTARRTEDSGGLIEESPTVIGVPPRRSVTLGDQLEWPVQRYCDYSFEGFACATIFEPFRKRYITTDAVSLPPHSRISVPMKIPEDWPLGLSQVVIVVAFGGEMSFLDFDIVVGAK